MGPRSSRTAAPPTQRKPSTPAAASGQVLGRGAATTGRPATPGAVLPEATARRETGDRDMRRKRPPALSLLLRMSTARRLVRIVSLLALDFVAVALAIFTALILKALVFDRVQFHPALHETERILPFAYLLTALLFARSGLYSARALRPGLSRIVGSLFQVAFVALLFAVVSGEHFSSYYLFYGSLAFALLYVSSLRAGYEWLTGVVLRAAGYRRRAVLVGRGKHIGDVAHALSDAPHSPIEVVGFLAPRALPENGLRELGRLEDLEAVLATERVDDRREVIHIHHDHKVDLGAQQPIEGVAQGVDALL